MSLPGVTPADEAFVIAAVRRAGSSFYHGMKLLAHDRRIAMYGVYAFCRVVDDIVDEPAPLAEKHAGLALWRARVAGLYRGEAEDAVSRVLRAGVRLYGLAEADFIGVIDGMAMDVGEPIVAPTLAELDLYCDRVAAAVGRLSVRVFGDASAAAQDVAHALGRALQLTNILRDLEEDAARGRLYLPREHLAAEGIPPEPRAALRAAALPRVLVRVAETAERYFAEAEAAMARADARAMRPARLMAASYRPLLGMMRARGFTDPLYRPSLPVWRKLALAARVTLARG